MAEQGTFEWHQARLGKLTASQISKVLMAPTTQGYQDYQAELITERLTGEPAAHYVSQDMEWGTEHEAQARAMYELTRGVDVVEVGFINHPTYTNSGASPDGLVGELGLVEIKCPRTATHIKTLLTGNIEKKYIAQMQWQMECTGREFCDFVSFDPRLPPEVQLYVQRVERDEEKLTELCTKVIKFLAEIDQMITKLTELKGIAA